MSTIAFILCEAILKVPSMLKINFVGPNLETFELLVQPGFWTICR